MEEIKTWYTASEIADLKLPGMPTTRQGVFERAKRYKWPARPYIGKGGGKAGGKEYLLALVLLEAELDEITPEFRKGLIEKVQRLESQYKDTGLILKYLQRLCKSNGIFLAETTER